MALLLRSLRSRMAAVLAWVFLIATLVVHYQGDDVVDSEEVVRRGLMSQLNYRRPNSTAPSVSNNNIQYPISGLSYKGGARTIYRAGELPHARSSLQPVQFPIKQTEIHYPGYWGPHGYVFLYQYETNVETRNHTSKHYIVHCYCIQQEECSCGQASHRDYFDNLPPKAAMVEEFTNLTRLYVNGTEDLAEYETGAGGQTRISLRLAFVALLMALCY